MRGGKESRRRCWETQDTRRIGAGKRNYMCRGDKVPRATFFRVSSACSEHGEPAWNRKTAIYEGGDSPADGLHGI